MHDVKCHSKIGTDQEITIFQIVGFFFSISMNI